MFPERTAVPPRMPGQPVISASVVATARRQQLVDLAKAFNIPIKADGTKAEILPVMVEAEQQGVFREQPKRPEYLVKAMRDPDGPPVDWESHRAPELDVNNFHHLQRIAKEHGVNSFGKGREALQAELKDLGII